MRPTKSSHCFEVDGKQVKFSSNFDSGNLRTVTQTGTFQFLVESSYDTYQAPASSKSFFHFKIQNYPHGMPIKIIIKNLNLLECIKQQRRKFYKPWYSYNGQDYHRLPADNSQITQQQGSILLKINCIMDKSSIYLAFSLPYSYQRYLNMIRDLPDSSQQFYIKKQVLCYSKNLHLVYMITITSFQRRTNFSDQIGNNNNGVILPQKHLNQQRAYFDKPVMLLSARVHPGQSPSSWAIQGIIKFLIGNSEQAKILRKYFQIVIVPMLNPDGVHQGMYRLDTQGHNLNRYYLVSDNRQPSIYSMKHLIKHYNTTKRLLFYFDFHGHPSFKGSFLYGNAIDDLPYQAQTQLFGRIMSINCDTFQQKYCIFDREQMSSKDRYDMYTKEGCARVYAFKTANILHSYTVQMGFHGCTQFPGTSQKNIENFYYKAQDYQNQGISIMKSVIQTCGLMKSVIDKKLIRKQIANQILSREERFRKQDKNISLKKKNVNQIIQNQYWAPIKLKYFCSQNTSIPKIRKISKGKVVSRTSFVSSAFIPHQQICETPMLQPQKCYQSLITETVQDIDESININKNYADNKRKKIHMRQMIFTTKKYNKQKNEKNQRTLNKKQDNPPVKKINLGKIQKKIAIQKIFQKPKSNNCQTKQSSSRNKFNQISFTKPIQTFQQHLFNDINIRKSSGDSINQVQTNNFCVLSAQKLTSRVQQLRHIFQSQKNAKQISNCKRGVVYKKYSSFFM